MRVQLKAPLAEWAAAVENFWPVTKKYWSDATVQAIREEDKALEKRLEAKHQQQQQQHQQQQAEENEASHNPMVGAARSIVTTISSASVLATTTAASINNFSATFHSLISDSFSSLL